MADYDENGNPVPPADAQAAREASLDPADGNSEELPTVTINAPPQWEKYIGWALLAGFIYMLAVGTTNQNEGGYDDE